MREDTLLTAEILERGKCLLRMRVLRTTHHERIWIRHLLRCALIFYRIT